MIGKSGYSFIHEEDRPKLIEIFQKILQTGKLEDNSVEYRAIHKDGSLRYHFSSGSPIFDDNGQLQGFRAIARDITDRKKLEKQLRASETMYRAIFDNVPAGIFTINREGYVTNINPYQLKNIDGGKAEDFIGKFNTLEFSKECNPEKYEYVKKTLAGEGMELWETPIMTADGRHQYHNIRGKPLFDAEGQCSGAVFITEDVTDRVKSDGK